MPGVIVLNPFLPTIAADRNGNLLYPTVLGQQRVASAFSLADLVNKYEIDPRTYATQTATGGTVTFVANQSAVQLSATNTNASSAKLRTNIFWRYQAGKALRVQLAVYHADSGQTNQTRRWGFFDDNDGVFFALSATTIQVVRRTSTSGSAVDNAVAQASWNVDKLDGTGASGVTLDITKANVYEIAFQWLGVGVIQFLVNGILAHEISTVNTLIVPFMKISQLPMSWEIVNTGASTSSSLTYLSSSVVIEAGQPAQNTSFAAFNSADITVSTTERPILSIRPKLTYAGITNRMLMLPFLMMVSTESGRAGYRLVMNSTLVGASWTSADANSGVEFDVAATSGSGGQTLLRGFLPNSIDQSGPVRLDQFFSDMAQGRSLRVDAFAANQDVLSIYGVNETTGTTSMRSSVSWDEIR
jgi:hypothetical protein